MARDRVDADELRHDTEGYRSNVITERDLSNMDRRKNTISDEEINRAHYNTFYIPSARRGDTEEDLKMQIKDMVEKYRHLSNLVKSTNVNVKRRMHDLVDSIDVHLNALCEL